MVLRKHEIEVNLEGVEWGLGVDAQCLCQCLWSMYQHKTLLFEFCYNSFIGRFNYVLVDKNLRFFEQSVFPVTSQMVPIEFWSSLSDDAH